MLNFTKWWFSIQCTMTQFQIRLMLTKSNSSHFLLKGVIVDNHYKSSHNEKNINSKLKSKTKNRVGILFDMTDSGCCLDCFMHFPWKSFTSSKLAFPMLKLPLLQFWCWKLFFRNFFFASSISSNAQSSITIQKASQWVRLYCIE